MLSSAYCATYALAAMSRYQAFCHVCIFWRQINLLCFNVLPPNLSWHQDHPQLPQQKVPSEDARAVRDVVPFFSTASRAKAIERYSQASWPVTTTRLPDYRAKRSAIPCPIRNKATNPFRSKRMHTMNIFPNSFREYICSFQEGAARAKIRIFCSER